MINPKDVTIVVPSLIEKTLDMGRAFLEFYTSIMETKPQETKLIVSANGGKESTEAFVHILDQGQCRAVNAAVAVTNTPWVMVTNDDMVYPPGWFEKLTQGVEELNLLCVSPKLIEPRPGAPTFEVYFCGGAGGDFDKQKFLDFVHTYKGLDFRTGFNLPFLIRRDLWDTVGGYDINYDPWGSNSDSDLEYKIKLAGVQPMQQTNAIVYHFSQTSGTFNPVNQEYWNKNFAYFEQKWGFPRTDQGIWEASFQIPREIRKFRPEWEGKYAK